MTLTALQPDHEQAKFPPKQVPKMEGRAAVCGLPHDGVGVGPERLLAEIVRLDRHHHRQNAVDNDLVDAVKLLARAHQQGGGGDRHTVAGRRAAVPVPVRQQHTTVARQRPTRPAPSR
jgi:hypothetical protein